MTRRIQYTLKATFVLHSIVIELKKMCLVQGITFRWVNEPGQRLSFCIYLYMIMINNTMVIPLKIASHPKTTRKIFFELAYTHSL